MDHKTKLLIIGSGPAGYTAAIYAVRAGLKPILVSGNQVGGQLTITTEIENFPGFPNPIKGPELMDNMHQQALNLGVEIIQDTITEVNFQTRPFVCRSENDNTFIADAIIIATGAYPRSLGLKDEDKFVGFGVSYCATCDGFFYRNKNVAVVGGGNSAVIEALHLAEYANSVTLIHRKDELRAEKSMQERLFKNKKIKIEFDSTVEELIGQDKPAGLTEIKIKNIKNNQTKNINVDGIFVAIGNIPRTDMFKNQLDLDENGYIITKEDSCQTSVQGVFAAGDVKNSKYRQAILAASSGCLASLEAKEFLQN